MVNVAWVVLHRKSPHWSQGTETVDATCALSGSISGDVKSGFACAGLLCSCLYAGCLNKRSCNFLFVARVGLCCGFCDFAVSFLVPPDEKWDREKCFSLFFY